MRIWVVTLFILAFGCSSQDPGTPAFAGNYLPLKVGAWFVYSVDSIVTDQGTPTTYSYDLKIEITDSVQFSSGIYTYVLQRSKRTDPKLPWSSIRTWSARFDGFNAIESEGNTAYVRIANPIMNGATWNGNEYNNLGGKEKCPGDSSFDCDLYTLSNVGKPYSGNGVSFSNSVTVIENDNEDTVVAEDVRSEIYAKGVGLIFRQIDQVNYCDTQDCAGHQQIDSGLNYKQTLSQYGF